MRGLPKGLLPLLLSELSSLPLPGEMLLLPLSSTNETWDGQNIRITERMKEEETMQETKGKGLGQAG